MPQASLLDLIVGHYLPSQDFNGLPLSTLANQAGLTEAPLRQALAGLVKEGAVILQFQATATNPHILRIPPELLAPTDPLPRLESDPLSAICAYPAPGVLLARVDQTAYSGRPYDLRLALGEAQLTPVYFELAVLENYHRDPRYIFDFYDYSGSVGIRDEYYRAQTVEEHHKIGIQSFGIGYRGAQKQRVVVVFLRYLADLSSEHQQRWKTHEVGGTCVTNSDYLRASWAGEWPEFRSGYDAFLQERREINRLAGIIGKPRFFTQSVDDRRPDGFHAMLRPTKQGFHDFVSLLDKLLSDSINPEFFKPEIATHEPVTRGQSDPKDEQVPSLTLLERWLSKLYRDSDGADRAREVVKPFREIRKIRSNPAHTISGNEYDESYPKQQDDLLGRAWHAVQTIRLILSSHPAARHQYEPPEWLDGDNIVLY